MVVLDGPNYKRCAELFMTNYDAALAIAKERETTALASPSPQATVCSD